MADTNFNAGFGIPLEYQTQLDALAQRRRLAEALQAQSIQPIQVPQYGPMASKLSPLAPLGQALATYLNQRNINSVSTEQNKVLADAQAGGQQEMGTILGMSDPQARIAAALVSKYPGIRTQGTGWQKSRDERVLAAGKEIMGQDPTSGMQILQQGDFPQGPYSAPPPKPPTFGTFEGNQYALTPNPGGKQTLQWAPKDNTVTVNNRLPTKEAESALQIGEKSLIERRTAAQGARGTLDSVQTAFTALQNGAVSGGGQEAVQSLRKAAQAFGVNLPDTASVDQLRAALGDGVLAVARKLAPVTQNDVSMLEQIKGSINTDPDALPRMLSTTYAIAMRDLQDYHRWLGEKQKGAASPYLRDAFAGEGIGLEQPPLTVPENTLAAIMLELQRRGGDTSGFTTPGGAPVSFKFRGDENINPRIVPQPPAGVQIGAPPAPRRRN